MYKILVFLSQQKKPKFDSLAIISTDKPTEKNEPRSCGCYDIISRERRKLCNVVFGSGSAAQW